MGSLLTRPEDFEKKEKIKIQQTYLLPEGSEFIFDYTDSERDNLILGVVQKVIEYSNVPYVPSVTSYLFEKGKLDDMTKINNLVSEKINIASVKSKRIQEYQILEGIRIAVNNYNECSRESPQKSQRFTCILNDLANKETYFRTGENFLFFQIENLLLFSIIHLTALNDQVCKFDYIYGQEDPDKRLHMKEYHEKCSYYHQLLIKHCNVFILKRFCSVEMCSCQDLYYKGNKVNTSSGIRIFCDAIVDYYYPKLKTIVDDFERFLDKLPSVSGDSIAPRSSSKFKPKKFFHIFDYDYEDFLYKFAFENYNPEFKTSEETLKTTPVTRIELEAKIQANSKLSPYPYLKNLDGTYDELVEYKNEGGHIQHYTRKISIFDETKHQMIWLLYTLDRKP